MALIRLTLVPVKLIKHVSTAFVASLFFIVPAHADDHSHDSQHTHVSPYTGQQNRQIKSLSNKDIEQLRAGAGWGLAKTAELNGIPGPIHLLEMRDQIALSDKQIASIEQLYESMNREARRLGEQLIKKEHALELRFQQNVPDSNELKILLDEIGSIRSSLRFAHLQAHLQTPHILTKQQIDKYNQLRGYLSGDPCKNVPEGHNEEMWKQHNNCE